MHVAAMVQSVNHLVPNLKALHGALVDKVIIDDTGTQSSDFHSSSCFVVIQKIAAGIAQLSQYFPLFVFFDTLVIAS
jgi:hypothetical protein